MIHKTYFSKNLCHWTVAQKICRLLGDQCDRVHQGPAQASPQGWTGLRQQGTEQGTGMAVFLVSIPSTPEAMKLRTSFCVQDPYCNVAYQEDAFFLLATPPEKTQSCWSHDYCFHQTLVHYLSELLVFRKFPEIRKFWTERQYFRKKK